MPYSQIELEEAHKALLSTLHKCEKIDLAKQAKSQRTLLERRISALKLALVLIEKEITTGEIMTTLETANPKCPTVPECPCPKTDCPNHGKCCSCVVKHREGGNLPFCLRERNS